MQKLWIWICKNLHDVKKQAPFFLIIHKMFVKKFDLIKIREKLQVEDYISSYLYFV